MSFRYRVATVFGGSGFIGRHLIKRLAKTGTIIRVATRHPSNANFLRTNGAVGQIIPIATNIHDDASVAAAVRDADIVINLIGILYESGVNTFRGTQGDAPGRIARAAKAAGVNASSDLGDRRRCRIDCRIRPLQGRRRAGGAQGVPGSDDPAPQRRVRPGRRLLQPLRCDGPHLAGAAADRRRPRKFQPVYVGDVADAIMKALENPAALGKTYELGGPRVYSFKEIMGLVLTETRRKRIMVTVPWGVAELQGKILGKLPKPLLTVDQVELLKRDNVVAPGAATLADLGVEPTAAEVIIPTYLDRFRVGGRFSQRAGGCST